MYPKLIRVRLIQKICVVQVGWRSSELLILEKVRSTLYRKDVYTSLPSRSSVTWGGTRREAAGYEWILISAASMLDNTQFGGETKSARDTGSGVGLLRLASLNAALMSDTFTFRPHKPDLRDRFQSRMKHLEDEPVDIRDLKRIELRPAVKACNLKDWLGLCLTASARSEP